MAGSLIAQKNFYVVPGASGNATSWQKAGDLSAVLLAAQPGDHIHLSEGTYLPTTSTDRSISFVVPSGVKLSGGYRLTGGTAERDVLRYRSILSGAIGDPGADDNTYHVVRITRANNATVLNGLTISHGNANVEGVAEHGGGLLNDGSNGSSLPVFHQVTFAHNNAREGGALYNNGRGGDASPTLVNCTFRNNTADLDGGAVFNNGGDGGVAAPEFTGCKFIDNLASYGAAIFIGKGNTSCNFKIKDCEFRDNNALLWGGAVYAIGAGADCRLELARCRFANNYPTNINKMRSLTQDIEGERVVLADVGK